jgi:hypothetical protein
MSVLRVNGQEVTGSAKAIANGQGRPQIVGAFSVSTESEMYELVWEKMNASGADSLTMIEGEVRVGRHSYKFAARASFTDTQGNEPMRVEYRSFGSQQNGSGLANGEGKALTKRP